MTEVESFLLYFYSNFLNQKLEENYYGKKRRTKRDDYPEMKSSANYCDDGAEWMA